MEDFLTPEMNKFIYNYFVKNNINKFKSINTNLPDYNPSLIINDNSFLCHFLVNELLKEINNVDKIISQVYEKKICKSKKDSFYIKMSKNHIELSPGDNGIYDKNIINEFLYESASVQNVINRSKKNFVIWNVQDIGNTGQESLKNIIKNCNKSASFICTSNNELNVSPSLRSSFNIYKINDFNEKFIKEFIQEFQADFFITNNLKDFTNKMIDSCKYNYTFYNFNLFLKNLSIWLIQKKVLFENINTSKPLLLFGCDHKQDVQMIENNLKSHVKNFYDKLKKIKINNENIDYIRKNLYEYYVYHFSFKEIMQMFLEFISSDNEISETKKQNMFEWGSYFDIMSIKGNKMEIHLEAFIFKFLEIFWKK